MGSITAPLCLLLPLHMFPQLQCGPLHGLPSFRINLLHCELSMSHRGISARVHGTPPPALTLVLAGLFLTHFSSLLSACMAFLPFLMCVFPEVPPFCLRGSAVPRGGSLVAGCAWHGAAPTSPRRLPCSLPCQHLGTGTQHSDKIILQFVTYTVTIADVNVFLT